MSPEALESLLLENPDKPHLLTLTSGDSIRVEDARSAIFNGYTVRVLRFIAPGRLQITKERLVACENIVTAELAGPTSASPPPPPRRKRGK